MAIPLDRLNNFKSVDKNMNINVLWVDTEQGERHVRRVIDRISEMTGAKMRVKRLIDKGLLSADGNLVRIPSNKVTS